MEKLKLETHDLTASNVSKLAVLFPAAITEGKVNFDMLRTLLGDDVSGDEAYEFTWVGKREAVREAGRPIRKTLRPCEKESKNWDKTENLYIEGDNLDVLKLLQESYLGKVKMIYIDPPYNTGNDFVYRDNFIQNREEYEDESGVYDEDGDRLFRNTESNGRFHSDWCSMIYPRLVLARNLLSNDGVIFISIDDNEAAQLRKVCDEIFGESNFVAQLIWQRAFSPKNDARFVSNSHDYVVMYAKSLNDFKIGKLPRTEEANARYSNPDNDPRGVWMSSDISVKTYNPESDYPVTLPSGRVVEPPTGRCWRLSKNAFLERLHDNRIWFGPDGNGTPRIKRFLSDLKFDGMAPTSIMLHKDVGHSQEGSQEVTKLLEAGAFDGPKPLRLLNRLLTLANTNKDSIVLDFFSGSATTAHAVMQLNAEDGGKRKFIMVQLPEPCADGTEAAKAGYANICEIGKERIRRAGAKISEQWLVNSEQKGTSYECSELQRASCLAKINAVDNGNLSVSKETAERGNIRSVGSTETSSSLNSIKYSGGTGEKFNERVYPLSLDSERITSGSGDPTSDMSAIGLYDGTGYKSSEQSFGGNKQDVVCPYQKTVYCPLTTNHLDTGFRVLKLADSNMNDVYYAAGDYTQDMLAQMESNIKSGRTDMDLLFGCLLDWGLPLSLPHTHEKIDGVTVHTYNNGDLIACFADTVSDKVVKEIAKRQPLRVVFRDSSFSSSPEKINVEEIFKLLAPNTSVKVL